MIVGADLPGKRLSSPETTHHPLLLLLLLLSVIWQGAGV